MEVRNCKRCGKIFYFNRNDICPDCIREEEETFKIVRDFLKEFPGSKITEVIEYTGVSNKKLLKFLRDGRIEIINDDDTLNLLMCLHCGKPIKMGRYCKECFGQYNDTVKTLYTEPVSKIDETPPRMRFINRMK